MLPTLEPSSVGWWKGTSSASEQDSTGKKSAEPYGRALERVEKSTKGQGDRQERPGGERKTIGGKSAGKVF